MYERILNAFYATPWAMTREKLAELQLFLRTKAAEADISPERVREIVAVRREREEQLATDLQASAARHPTGARLVGRVAVLSVFGVISQRVGMLEEASGGVSTEKVGAALDGLVADRTVKAIVLAFDSPGGSVYGVQELADKIRGYRSEKKIVGLADSVAASAAYWLASQTAELNVTPGGQVGSIGVLAVHEDLSAYLEEQGVKTTVIAAGKYKTEGSPYGPLDEEARAELQSKVDHYYTVFVDSVAKGRNVSEAKVKAEYGQGRMVTAKDAVERGMADRVATLEQVLRRLGAGAEASGPSAGAIRSVDVAARCAELGL